MDDELTARQAAKLTGYSARHIKRLVQAKTVKGRQIAGWLYLVDRESILAYAERMRVLGDSKHNPGG